MAAQPQQTQTSAVAKLEPRAQGVVGDVQRMEKQFALALPDHVSPEKFVRVVMTAINTNPDLQKADRQSVLAAAMKCAQDGLMPDGREAALVTYGNKASYLPMIAGVLTKVRRSGELETINAHVVYEKDVWSYTLGDEERIEHQPYMDGDRGKAIAVYAIAKTKDGGIYREVMSVSEVEQVRNVSRAKGNGPWVQWWGEMARKTVLRRLSKRLPMSTDLQQVFQRDDDHYDFRQQAHGAATLRRLHADFDEPVETKIEEVTVVDDVPPSEGDPAADKSNDLPDGVQRGSEIKTDQQWSELLEADLKKAADAGDKRARENIWSQATGLRNRLDKSNPERLAEIEAAFQQCFLDVEDAAKEQG
jgi:recombination protein RecT